MNKLKLINLVIFTDQWGNPYKEFLSCDSHTPKWEFEGRVETMTEREAFHSEMCDIQGSNDLEFMEYIRCGAEGCKEIIAERETPTEL